LFCTLIQRSNDDINKAILYPADIAVLGALLGVIFYYLPDIITQRIKDYLITIDSWMIRSDLLGVVLPYQEGGAGSTIDPVKAPSSPFFAIS